MAARSIAGVAAVVAGEKTGEGGIPKHIVTDGPVVTKANAAGHAVDGGALPDLIAHRQDSWSGLRTVIASAAKQSRAARIRPLDCFVGCRLLAMTAGG